MIKKNHLIITLIICLAAVLAAICCIGCLCASAFRSDKIELLAGATTFFFVATILKNLGMNAYNATMNLTREEIVGDSIEIATISGQVIYFDGTTCFRLDRDRRQFKRADATDLIRNLINKIDFESDQPSV